MKPGNLGVSFGQLMKKSEYTSEVSTRADRVTLRLIHSC